MRELVADFSEPGEFVCDPYAGSGTTGIACAQLGRRFLGWERDAAMAVLAQRRLAGLRAVPVPGQIEMFWLDLVALAYRLTLHHGRVGSARRACSTRSRQR
jgi:tRNA G10  N-methylase Trm11